ncbi:MAG: response regulator [Venatoribacter sp.]
MLNLEKSLRNKHILVLDDMVEARSALKAMLTQFGANKIDVVNNGWEAAQLIAEKDYDIILSDYNLGPGKDGQQVLEEARYTNRLKSSALFILVTGENAIDMVMGALEYEPDNYITKPFTLNTLKERLIRILKIKNELSEIDQAIDAKQPDQAIALARAKLAEKPNWLVPLTRVLGKLYLQLEHYQEAHDLYKNLLDKRPVAWAKLGYAISLYRLGKNEEALAVLSQTIQEHPRYVQCYDWKATILQELNRHEDAQEQLEQAVNISPKAVLRQMSLGQLALKNRDFRAAEIAYDQAIRLGRFSCYKNAQNYLNYAVSAEHSLINSDDNTSLSAHKLVQKTLKVLDELTQDYGEQSTIKFDALIAASNLYLASKNDEKASEKALDAISLLDDLVSPDLKRMLQMADALVRTQQHIKAQDVVNEVRKHPLTAEIEGLLQNIEKRIDRSVIEAHLSSLNSQGMELFSQKDYVQAIALFDQAAQDRQASISVLMNAIQAKISLMENDGVNHTHLQDCRRYIDKIGVITQDDSRFERFERLKNAFVKLWKNASEPL